MKYATLLITLILFTSNLYAVEETISYWDKSSQNLTYYTDDRILVSAQTFYPEAPCYLKKVSLWFYGEAGTATILILDHQAGESAPGTFLTTGLVLASAQDVQINPNNQVVQIDVNIPDIYTADNHFFIAVQTSQGLHLISDGKKYDARCESSSGGYYGYQSLLFDLGNNNLVWGGYYLSDGQGNLVDGFQSSFAVDVAVDYPTKTTSGRLRDVTAESGLPTDISNQGLAWADINGDGYRDLLARGRLFINNEGVDFTEKTEDYGLSGSCRANSFVDMDNDGDLDIIFFQSDGGKSKLYINNNNIFTESKLNIPVLESLTSFSFADINEDGFPDLFLGQLWGNYPEAKPNFFLLNDGNGDFTDNTTMIYPDYDGEWNYPDLRWDPANYIIERNRNSRGSQWVDFNEDGDLDLYVTNYFLQEDEFYENNGDGSFTYITKVKGIDQNATGSNHGTGVDWYDYDNDGDMDLLLPQFAHPRFLIYDHRGTTIYQNSGAPEYDFKDTYDPEQKKSGIGIQYEETHAGAAWGDVNNDGLADFIISTFYGCRYIDLYLQNEEHNFVNATFNYGLENIVTGVDAVWVDYNNDGNLDLAFGENGKLRLFKNTHEKSNHFVECNLVAKNSNKYAIGARVKVYAGNDVYMQQVNNGRGQNMQRPYRLHFGLGNNNDIEKIEVRWPGDTDWEIFTGIHPGDFVTLVEGEGNGADVEDISSSYFYINAPVPNPFKNKSKIEFHTNKNLKISIDIFDINGNKISNLANKIFPVGSHSAEWLPLKIPSGVYYCKFTAGDIVRTVKMVFNK